MKSNILTTLIQDVSDLAGKYPVSTAGAFFSAVNWQMFTPIIIQLCLLAIDYARIKWIKKDRAEELQKVHDFTDVKIEEAKTEIIDEISEVEANQKPKKP